MNEIRTNTITIRNGYCIYVIYFSICNGINSIYIIYIITYYIINVLYPHELSFFV